MAFQEDVAQIPLTNILQALMLSGQEGVLTVQCATFRRRVRLLKAGLRPLNYESDTPDLLKLVLLKERLLTESQFQNILSTWNSEHGSAGDFLIERRIIKPEVVENNVQRQLWNLLLDMLTTPGVQYQFAMNAEAAQYELFSRDKLSAALTYNVNGILMETARQEDEWQRFRSEITSGSQIYQASNPSPLSSKGLPVPPANLKEVKPLIQGNKTVDGIVSSTTLSRFEVYEVLFHLKKARLIRPLGLADKKSRAEKLRLAHRVEEAAAIYQSILAEEPGDTDTRERLVSLLENTEGHESALIEQYLSLADLSEKTDVEQCISYLRKVIDLRPGHLPALESLFNLCHTTNRRREASASLRAGIAAALHASNHKETVQLLQRLVKRYPKEVLLLHELADAYSASKDTEKAVACLKDAATQYKNQRESIKFRKVLAKIAQLQPSEAPKLRKLLVAEQSVKVRLLRTFKIASATFVSLGLLTFVIFLALNEHRSRIVFAELLKDIETHKRYGSFQRANLTLADFGLTFPYSSRRFVSSNLAKELADLEDTTLAAAKEQMQERRATAESTLFRAQLLASKGDYGEALKALNRVDAKVLPPALETKRRALHRELVEYFSTSEELLNRVKAAKKSEDVGLSHRLTKEILERFPRSPSAEGLRLPILIETEPAGAELRVDGRTVGTTPDIFEFLPAPGRSVLLVKKGYTPIDLGRHTIDGKPFDPMTFHHLSLRFEKALEWKFSPGASVECFPATRGSHVYFGTRSGVVFCLEQRTGAKVWEFQVPTAMDLAGGLGLWSTYLYFGGFDGSVYVLNARTGREVHPPIQATPQMHSIKTAASQANAKGVVAVNCGGKVLTGINLSTGQITWREAFADTRILGQPQTRQDSVYIASDRGEVLEVALSTGEVRRRLELKTALSNEGAVVGNRFFVANAKGTVIAVDLDKWQTTWTYDCGKPFSAPPTVDSESVVLPMLSGTLVCLSTDGQLKWSTRLGRVIAATGVVFRNTFLVGTTNGEVISVDLWTGKPKWKFLASKGREKRKSILAQGAVSQGKFFIGSEDEFFYCFTLD